MPRNIVAAGALLAAFSFFASAQQPRGAASQQSASADSGDFAQDGLKFHKVSSVGTMTVYMATDIGTANPAGQVLDRGNGSVTVQSFPGFDKPKIEAAYMKHGKAGDVQPAEAATNAAPATNADATAISNPALGFDAASKTVTLSGGRAVTFVDSDNLKVQMPGPAGNKIYELHFHKASAGGFTKVWAAREQGRVGGSLGGGGVTISLASQNGMPGGEVYDTAKGTVYGNSGFVQAKSVTAAVREATDFVKNGAQPDLAKLNVVKSLLSNNLGM